LWQGERPVALRPKTWQVLRLLVERPGDLVHSEEFLDAVWSDVDVTLGTLTQSIAELRRVLGDDASQPRFIQTVHHRGYRFIADVESSPSPEAPHGSGAPCLPPSPAFGTQKTPEGRWLAGRQAEFERLDRLMQQARAGNRQIVFVTGEAGIGKTTLIRTFLKGLTNGKTEEPVWIAGGKCVEFVGEGETYLPALEAFERLVQVVEPKLFRNALRDRAPTWLAQIPWLLEPGEEQAAPSSVHGPWSKRMLREFCVAVEALTAEGTLVLWFEDLHWSDSGTVDLLAALASRTEPSRLCVLATYRPVEAAMNAHPIAPLKRNLLQQQACVELPLGLLEKTEVRSYLDRQFAPGLEPSLVDLLYEQTEGNPLFVVALVNHLVAEDLLGQTDVQSPWALNGPLEKLRDSVPETLTELVELQLSHMDAKTVSALEAGSVEGVTFGAQAVAAATDEDVESVERTLRVLVGRDGFLEATSPEQWPDGSVGEGFRFLHAAFGRVLYRRQAAAQRQRFHRRIAGRFEEGFQTRSGPLAATLALHFERGGDPERAVHYLVEAAAGGATKSRRPGGDGLL
jgi:predicted ATPase/DNA-binding winged helix-turn-helix (wHTH) protein